MPNETPALLDGARIRTLRHAAGLSARELARRLGVSPTSIAHLETGTNHGELPLRLLAELAQTLAVSPSELLTRSDDHPPHPAEDDRTVEAALLIAGAPTSTRELADALGWSLARIRAAIDRLHARLVHTGLRVHDCGWQRHALRPATEHLTDHQQHALHRLGPIHRGLTAQTAALLRLVAEQHAGETTLRHVTNSQRVALQSLLKQ